MKESEMISVVQKVQDYIEQNITRSITLEQLSIITGYSPWYVAKIFKEVTGKSPYEYIRLRRLTMAAILLKSGSRKVIDVALDLVYDSQEGFTRAFSKEFGIAPGKYRTLNPQLKLFMPENISSFNRLSRNIHKEEVNMKQVYFRTDLWKLDALHEVNNCALEEFIGFDGKETTCWHLKGKGWNWTTIRQELDFDHGEEIELWFWAKMDFYGRSGSPKCYVEIFEYEHFEERMSEVINSKSPQAVAVSGYWVLYHYRFKPVYGAKIWLRIIASQVNIAVAEYKPGDEKLPGVVIVNHTDVKLLSEFSETDTEPGIYLLPSARIIGKSLRVSMNKMEEQGIISEFIDKFYSEGLHEITKSLPILINNSSIELSYEYNSYEDNYMFIIGCLVPADTPVPEGFDYKDIRNTHIVIGGLGQWFEEISSYWKEFGYVINDDEDQRWNAMLCLDEVVENNTRLICPIREREMLIDEMNNDWEITDSYPQELPDVRFVGIKYGNADRKNGSHQWLWDEWHKQKRFQPLEELITDDFRNSYKDADAYVGLIRGMTNEEMQYHIGMFLPADAKVPEGYSYFDIPSTRLGVCLLHGYEEDVHCREEDCSERIVSCGMAPKADSQGAWWRIERYSPSRYQPDEEGKIVMDLCHFVKRRYLGVKHISEMIANVNEVEIFEMPQIKLIGREVRCGGPDFLKDKASELWEIILEDGSFDIIKKLPSIIPGAMMAWTGNYTEEDKTYSYIIGKFVPSDTQVPKGFSGRILPETLVAKGIYGQGYSMIDTYKEWGYTQNYELFGWNAEVVFDTDPDEHDWKHFCQMKQWTNISPVKKSDNM